MCATYDCGRCGRQSRPSSTNTNLDAATHARLVKVLTSPEALQRTIPAALNSQLTPTVERIAIEAKQPVTAQQWLQAEIYDGAVPEN